MLGAVIMFVLGCLNFGMAVWGRQESAVRLLRFSHETDDDARSRIRAVSTVAIGFGAFCFVGAAALYANA